MLAAGLVLAITAYAQQPEKVSVTDLQVIPGPAVQAQLLTGTATNVTNHVLQTVILEFNLYDAQDAQVGNTSAVSQNLSAGGTWKFRALTVQPFSYAKLAKIIAN